jgi:PAS domain S-box-containing protein
MHAPLLTNEAERLDALRNYQILDTPTEAAFERLTRLAARLFQVPIALVSFVDAERLWAKSCFGLNLLQIERTQSFCAYTILADQVFVVPDTATDPRFIAHTLVTEPPHIRFYAGAPLTTPDGYNLGSFCIIDTVPRRLNPEQQSMLADLAALVVDELELRRTARDLRASESRLRQTVREHNQLAVAVDSLTSGVVITDPYLPDHPIIFANPGFSAITGYSLGEIVGSNCRFLQGPGTDPAMLHALRMAVARQESFTGVLLNYHQDGTPFLNELTVNPVFDEEGQLQNYVGLQHDVTEREQAKQLLEQRVEERAAELAHAQIEILKRLARAAEFRDDDTGEHTQRVARIATLLAQTLGIPAEQVTLITHAAPLHDVGKIAIADQILLKPGRLTEAEFATMKTHTTIGAALLSDGRSDVVQMAARIAAAHHERWDGTGYPHQLAGEQIPLEARILAIADVFDALTHARPYKHAWSVSEAVAEISRLNGTHFDPQIVEAFLRLPHEDLI